MSKNKRLLFNGAKEAFDVLLCKKESTEYSLSSLLLILEGGKYNQENNGKVRSKRVANDQ